VELAAHPIHCRAGMAVSIPEPGAVRDRMAPGLGERWGNLALGRVCSAPPASALPPQQSSPIVAGSCASLTCSGCWRPRGRAWASAARPQLGPPPSGLSSVGMPQLCCCGLGLPTGARAIFKAHRMGLPGTRKKQAGTGTLHGAWLGVLSRPVRPESAEGLEALGSLRFSLCKECRSSIARGPTICQANKWGRPCPLLAGVR
jgi:hypothetical protein